MNFGTVKIGNYQQQKKKKKKKVLSGYLHFTCIENIMVWNHLLAWKRKALAYTSPTALPNHFYSISLISLECMPLTDFFDDFL